MMGVDRQESSNSTKATSSRMVRGVAGLSNIVGEGRELARPQRNRLKPDENERVPDLQPEAHM